MSRYGWRAGLAALVLPVAAIAGGARLDAPTVAAALAGRYDNVAQVEAERRSGVAAAHEPLALTITPVTAPLVADVVLFVQEGAADDPRRGPARRERRGAVSGGGRRWRATASRAALRAGRLDAGLQRARAG